MADAKTSPAPEKRQDLHINRRNLINLAVLLLLLYVVLPQIGKFRDSFSTISRADPRWLILGVIIALSTYLPAAASYVLLAKKKLKYGRTVIVELASTFVNRLLPIGAGAVSVNYAYLRRNGHTKAEASAVVTANLLIGIFGLTLLLAYEVIVRHLRLGHLDLLHAGQIAGWAGLAVVILIVALRFFFRKTAERLAKTVTGTAQTLAGYRKHPVRLVATLLSSMTLTVCYTTCLFLCLRSVNVRLPFEDVLAILTLGQVGASISPTPGGLIGVEAGLVAGLVAYGTSGSLALAAALLYRLVTYWLALLMGATVFLTIRRRKYF